MSLRLPSSYPGSRVSIESVSMLQTEHTTRRTSSLGCSIRSGCSSSNTPSLEPERASDSYDEYLYRERHLVECFIGKIHYRRIFSRQAGEQIIPAPAKQHYLVPVPCRGRVRERICPSDTLTIGTPPCWERSPYPPEISHRRPLQRMDSLLRQQRGITQSLADVLRLHVRVPARRAASSSVISCVDMPLATRLSTRETVIRMPLMQARPPITFGSKVIRSSSNMGHPLAVGSTLPRSSVF